MPADEPASTTIDTPFDAALSERYLVYALSTITARSLPDVRDGLKPVHRRLLWAMRLLRLDPAGSYKKSARVVGDVIGKYHPHGDASVYDAMVRLAQEFALRYPLVDGQGNFGNIDGDNAAAYRYTEAKLTAVAAQLMSGLDEGTVDFKPTYNGEEEEPEVFPGLFPNLLANGASGIAVGMATSIPPHNVGELIEAATHLIDNPLAEHRELMDFVSGPDFPTGGVLVDSREVIAQAYATGRGSFRLRARFSTGRDAEGEWEPTGIEKLGGGMWQLVISEVPYGVPKAKLIEQIAELIANKKLPILEDIRDESDDKVRVVLVPRSRNVDVELLKESLYRLTDLEIRFPLNLNVLDATRTPGVMSLKQALAAWLAFQFQVLVRRAQVRIGKIDDRLELLDGFLIAFLNLDRVIEIIRTEDEPKVVMMAEFSLTDRQAEAILNMRLRSLRKLEEMEIGRERAALAKERADLASLIEDKAKQRRRMKKQLAEVKAKFGDGRRTHLQERGAIRAEIDWSAMIEKEPITVILSQRGWIRAMKGHVALDDAETLKFREGDGLHLIFHAQTTDKLLLAAENGRVYTLGGDKLPGGRGFGEPVRLSIDLPAEVEIATLFVVRPEMKLLVASSDGRGFVTSGEAVLAETRKGKQLLNLRPGAKLSVLRAMPEGADTIAVMGENRKMLVFRLDELPEMGRGSGVQLQRYRDGGLADVVPVRFADGLSWSMGGESGRTRTEADLTPWRGIRGASGRMAPNGFPRSNRFSG